MPRSARPPSGQPQLVDRLVGNLIDNAIRHNTAGGRIEVTTTTAQAGRPVGSQRRPGDPAGELERISQPFQRLGTERTSQGGGYGLGLSIVYAIATAHEATLAVHPQPAGGLHVTISFPNPDLSGTL